MQKTILYGWPNKTRSVAGGSRTVIKLSRPWQQKIVPYPADPSACPFCNGKGEVVETFFGGEWQLLQNKFTPYSYHRMLVPKGCWGDGVLRRLGGRDQITRALSFIWREIKNSNMPNVVVSVHIGALAGQNIPHLHYHIFDYAMSSSYRSVVPKEMDKFFKENPNLVFLWDLSTGIRAGVGGVRAGQCFLLPSEESGIRFGDRNVPGLALVIDRVLELYEEKFKSIEGLAPDFSLGFQFERGSLKYGLYTPVLNHWGGAEQLAFYEGYPRTLPWPHEVTAEHLLSKEK